MIHKLRQYIQQLFNTKTPASDSTVAPEEKYEILDPLLEQVNFTLERWQPKANGDSNILKLLYDTKLPLYQSLLGSLLYVPTLPTDDPTDKEFALFLLKEADNSKTLPVFTCLDHFQTSGISSPHNFIALDFQVIATLAVEHGLSQVVFNPGTRACCVLDAFELCYLAEGHIPPLNGEEEDGLLLTSGTSITMGLPQNPPSTLLLERVTGLLSKHQPLIEAAYIFEISIDSGPAHLALGVKMEEGCEDTWEESLLPSTLAISQEVLDNHEYIDLFLLNQSQDMEAGVQRITTPFFTGKPS